MRLANTTVAASIILVNAMPTLAQNTAPMGGPPMGPPPATSHRLVDAPAGVYQLDKRHASVIVRILHQGLSHYPLRLDAVDATLNFDPANLDACTVEATLDPASLDVADPSISSEFAQKFLKVDGSPKITFASTGIKPLRPNRFAMTGNLTLHGVTKPVTLQVDFNGTRPDMSPSGGKRVGFTATGSIKRGDFGIAAGIPTSMLGEELSLDIEAEFAQKK